MEKRSYEEMCVKSAIGVGQKTATDILYNLGSDFSGKGYAWLKRHLVRLMESGQVSQVNDKGTIKYSAR